MLQGVRQPLEHLAEPTVSGKARLVGAEILCLGAGRLERWTGPWPADDKDANFKADVALYSAADPLRTVTGLSASTGIPVGAIVRYVLARWASEGASGLLELGPTMVRRLEAACTEAEDLGTDEARLAAYGRLRQMLEWLAYPLEHPEVYEDP